MVAKRILEMTPSATSMLMGKIAELRAAGTDVIGFNVGEPDFPTPEAVVDSCREALAAGHTKYVGVGGIQALREAVCEKLERDNHLRYEPSQICISTGAKQALYNAIMTLCDPGDEVIVPKPCWVSYVEIIKLAGGVPVLVDTNSDFSLNVSNIEAAVTEKTKAVLINTPNNPTGAVYDRPSIQMLGDVVVKHRLYVISDEIYEKLIYGNAEHISIAALSPELYERTVVVNGFSKAYSMTGWRIGYSAASAALSKAMTGLQSHITSNSTSFVQYAAVTALKSCGQDIENMKGAFRERRDYMYRCLNQIEGISCGCPQGAFYLMPQVGYYIGKKAEKKEIKTASDLCDYLLEAAHVATVPGEAFYMPNTIRFSYSASLEEIERGMEQIKEALARLR